MSRHSNILSRVILAIISIASLAGQLPAAAINVPPANIDVDVSVSPSMYEGVCPGTIKFTAKIKSDGPANVRYTWLRSDGATAPIESITFTSAGESYVSTTWTLGDAVALPTFEGWQQIRIVSPADIVSNQAKFTLKCGGGKQNPNGVGESNKNPNDKKVVDIGSKVLDMFGKKQGGPPQQPAPQPQPPDCNRLPGGCNTSSPPQAEFGRFRITVNGFRCDRRTNDKFLDEDGAKDEVFLQTDAALYDLSTHRNQPSHLSPVIGDSNTRPDRIRAGRATSIGGGNGGFEDGDAFPSTTPWIRSGAPSDSRPPMIAWEGTLTQGADALALIPSIWESDESNARIGGTSWIRALADTWINIDGEMQRAIRSRSGIQPADSLLNNVARNFDGVRIPNAGNNDLDRPIGMEFRGGEYGYVPKIFVLTYDAADRAARGNTTGLGEGIIAVRFRDSGDLVGDYTIFLQVERLSPDGSCAADLGSTFTGSASLTTSNTRAPGPFTQPVSIGIGFANCRSTVSITRLDPIVADFDVEVLGHNTSTLTLIGGGTGSINTATGRIDIPVQLRLTNTQPLGGTSLIDITLSTEGMGGSRLRGGMATLIGTGTFRGGFLGGSTGTITVTGTFAPAP